MPIAIVIGCAPVVMFTGPQKLAIDMDELGVAGALAGAPIEMAKAVTVDLDVPASSEIVIEGLIDPEKLEPEAPFGESNGYVALEAYNMPMRVTAITHKRNPVFASIISQVTPSESSVIKKVAYEPLFLSHLRDRLGIKGVLRVAMHERLTNLRPVIFVQLAEGTPRSEVWRALHGAATLQSNCGKIVIAVSEDIDPLSMDAVLWSLAYRTNPIEDVHIVPNRGGVQGAQYGPKTSDSGMLVDATRKYPMAPLALPTREYMEHARALWEELDLYPLNVQSPWHGYGLGDWTDRWETFARRAATGDWELSGQDTLARQTGGLSPESPARFDDKPKKPEFIKYPIMARLPYLDRSDLPPEHQDLLKRNINLHRLLAHSPNGTRAFNGLGNFIRHGSRLDPRLREMAILQVGYLARSPYEYSHHVKIGRDFGVSDDDIRAITDETEGRPSKLEPLAKAVLRAAREMTTDLAISDEPSPSCGRVSTASA